MWRTVGVLVWAWAAAAQMRPAFEAASVKPAQQGRSLQGGPGTNSPGQISGTASLKSLVMRAYEMKSYQVSGPAWMDTERYEIAAKIPAGADKAQVSLMMQTLLAERFRLVAHRETRELPIYALMVGKNGPKFKTSEGPLKTGTPKLTMGADGFPDVAPGSEVPRSYQVVAGGSDGILYKVWARRETMQQLADRLSSQLNRAVVDRTALQEQYDFALSWTMETAGGGVPRTDPPPDEIEMHSSPVMNDPGLSIFTAVQTQLGLRLESGKGPLEMLIVDRAEKIPTGN